MKGRAKQPGKALMRRRVEEILRIRLDGAEWWDCCEFVREKEQEEGSAWYLAEGDKPLSDASLRRYLAKADNLIAESCRASRKKLFRRHLAQRRNLYAKAVHAGDIRTASGILRDEAELEGLYPPKKIAPTNPEGTERYDGSLSDAERLALLIAAFDRARARLGGPDPDGQGDAPGLAAGGPGADSGGDRSAGPVAGASPAGGTGPDPLAL
jgi:hypothetical protein